MSVVCGGVGGILKWQRLRTGGLGSTSKEEKKEEQRVNGRDLWGRGSKSRNSKSWSHCPAKGAKAVCVRKTAWREEKQTGPMEAFWTS